MENLNTLAGDFNELLIDLVSNIADICPKSTIGVHIKDIVKVINTPKHKVKFIEWFVINILVYKSEIESGNDSFFMNKLDTKEGYSKELKGYERMTDKLFEFRNIWGSIKSENKLVIIEYMKLLCQLAQNYFDITYSDE